LGLFDISDILSDAISHQPVLEPLVRTFYLAFSLGRQGISDFDITIF